MTFKVGHGNKSSPDVNRGNAPGKPHSHGHSDHSETRGNRTYGHDHTPTRQRELETHGHNARARIEGQSHKHGDKSHSPHSTHSDHSQHFNSSRSERGIGVRVDGDVMGLEIEARVGLNRSHDGGRSHNSHGRYDGHSNAHFDAGGQSRANSPRSSQHHPRGEFNGHNESGRTGSHHHSEGQRIGFDQGNEHHWNGRSSEGIDGARHLLRDTVRTLRHELNSFRSDSREGPANRPLGLTGRHIERVLHHATRGFEDRLSQGGHSERIVRQVISDASGVARLTEHFSRLERIGGEPVRHAYETVLNFALNEGEAESNRLRLIAELLRDLNSGAFLHPRDMEGPFPLTGRARIVSEMMALIRTLEAIERFAAEIRANPNSLFRGDLSNVYLGGIPGGLMGGDLVELLAQVLTNSGPTLPGLAGRLEIPRLISALGGVLTDPAGRPLIMADGAPLKLGELLWFNARADVPVDLWALDRFPTRLSPLLVHGFDAVYSLIGFDGRQLSLPRFMAIQSQINASEFEWFFGQAPLSEGWIRSAIEFLKDSISFDHNVLGELLEEAVTSGRFHLTLMRGTVEEGKAVSGSFTFTPMPNFNLSGY